MPAERYFIEDSLETDSVLVEEQEHHHLVHVMRAKKDDTIEIINGRGCLAEGVIKELSKKSARIEIISRHKESLTPRELILAQAIPRINRLDYIVEKCTELGITQLWLFPGILSERKELTPHQIERLRNLAIAAIKQSGRLWLPEIHLRPPLKEWKEVLQRGFFGDTSATEEDYLAKHLLITPVSKGVIFFTGPESGFDSREEQKLKEMGVQGVKLLDAILRTDTASIMAVSLLASISK